MLPVMKRSSEACFGETPPPEGAFWMDQIVHVERGRSLIPSGPLKKSHGKLPGEAKGDAAMPFIRRLRRLFGLAVLFLVSSSGLRAADPLVHTYSIVAVDTLRGEIGVAVQSHWFAVGASCAWARPGVGAVATQAMTRPRYGFMGLALMALGQDPATAFATMARNDGGAETRQVSLVDVLGRTHGHTGTGCIADARHRLGKGYVVAANLMVDEGVVKAMARAFEKSAGPLADRLLLALKAAQEAGGDLRGRQSAAMKVVRSTVVDDPWKDVVVDLRVDDHRRPLQELERLLRLQKAYKARSLCEDALAAGDFAAAELLYEEARNLAPRKREFAFWYAVGLARAERFEEARRVWLRSLRRDRRWWTFLERLPGSSVMPDPSKGRRILAEFVKGLRPPRDFGGAWGKASAPKLRRRSAPR